MSSVYIKYRGVDAFAPQPTPLIGVEYTDIYYEERWAQKETFTLQGWLTGCSYSGIAAAQVNLLNSFNTSYQTLEIWQQTGVLPGLIYSKPLAQVELINFPQSKMFGVQEYSISLTCYPSGLFSGAYGILEPQDSWSFREQQNATLETVHTISCRAFNTSAGNNNAIDNARNWAFGRTGINFNVYPTLISGTSLNNFCLLEQHETVNRFNGNYSIVETYTNDLARTGYGVIRYNSDIKSGNNLITISLNGTAQGCGKNITGLRYAYNLIDKVAVASKVYQDTFGMNDLNPIPLSQSFVEDAFTTHIDFSYIFNNDNSPIISFDYTVDLFTATNGTITAGIQGMIRVRGGNQTDKLLQAMAYADTVNLYNLILPFYTSFDISSIAPLNPVPIINGRELNESDGTVQLTATYTNETKVSDVLDRFLYTINFIKAVEKVDSKPALNGLGVYSTVNLGYANRASININGTAIVNSAYPSTQGIPVVKQKALALFSQYGRFSNTVLDQDEIQTNRPDDKSLTYSFTWSFDGIVSGPSNIIALAI